MGSKRKRVEKRLAARIKAHEETLAGKSDIARKHPQGFRRPGSRKFPKSN